VRALSFVIFLAPAPLHSSAYYQHAPGLQILAYDATLAEMEPYAFPTMQPDITLFCRRSSWTTRTLSKFTGSSLLKTSKTLLKIVKIVKYFFPLSSVADSRTLMQCFFDLEYGFGTRDKIFLDPGSPIHISESSSHNFLGNKYFNSASIGSFKNKIIYYFVKFMATKKVRPKNFSPLFVIVGFGIQDGKMPDPG
jgi:hypothetical protein